MECLKGRSVEIVSGAYHASRLGEVVEDRGEQCVVRCPANDEFGESIHYVAKFRLLCSEYAFCDVPSAVGVYLIAKPFVEEAA
jgi:hypothetical protein